MQFNMLENSMDSFNEAIEYYINGKRYEDERCYKFCIFMIYHTAELLLKEILFREHKVLILEKIEDYNKIEEDPKTVGFKIALNRVRDICRINLGKYYNYLLDLAWMRNKIQHYEINTDGITLIKIIMSSFSAIEYLVLNVLNTNFDNFNDLITREEIEILHSDQENYQNRKRDIGDDIKTKNLPKILFEYYTGKFIDIPCPKCSETYLVNEPDSKIKCMFCGEKYNSAEDLYTNDKYCFISTFMERELGKRKTIIHDLRECILCNYKTLVFDKSICQWKCGACGKVLNDEDIMDYQVYQAARGKEDWEADVADMMEDPHYSHLWK